jgi:hypothetical protein
MALDSLESGVQSTANTTTGSAAAVQEPRGVRIGLRRLP